MKITIAWKRIFLFAVISVGILLLTSSLAIAAGTLLLLFAVDHFLEIWETNRNKKSEDQDDKAE